jgi:GNAT superfamily N-acetyltransferase
MTYLASPTSELLAHLDRHITELHTAHVEGKPHSLTVDREQLLSQYAKASPFRHVFIHTIEEKVVGHSILTQYVAPGQTHRASLSAGVEAPYRSYGIGRDLISEALEHARHLGIEYVDGTCLTSNPARLLDLSLGAKEVGLVKDALRVQGISHNLAILVWEL